MKIRILAVVFLLSACAHSPQQIALNNIDVNESSFALGDISTVSLVVQDERESTVAGSMGGLYANSSVVEISDFSQLLLDSLATNLKDSGFDIIVDSPLKLNISILQTSFELSENNAASQKLKRQCVLKLEVVRPEKTVWQQAGTIQNDIILTIPSEEDNQLVFEDLCQQSWQKLQNNMNLQNAVSGQ